MLMRILDLTQLVRLLEGWYRFRPIEWRELLGRFRHYQEIYHQRSQLRELTDDQLEDIGISRDEADREANKAFWQD